MTRSLLILIALLAVPAAAPAAAAPAPAGATEWSGRACPYIYRPVCARTRFGRFRTYPNACVARNARARIVHGGPCRRHR